MITGTYDHYMWYFPQTGSCGWSGLANVGTPQRPSKDTWYNGSSGCVVLAQEIGHNFGEMHSSSLACSGASFSNTPTSCTPSRPPPPG